MSNEQQQESGNNNNNNQAQIENIKVAVRLRPFTEREKQRNSKRIVDIEQNTIALYSPKYGAQDEPKKFTFDYSYWSHDGFRKRQEDGVNVPDLMHPNGIKYVGQEQVFNDLGLFLLNNALQGYNSALLAYGQTGSGKSYTVSGYGTNEGILPRFARQLFSKLNERLGDEAIDANIASNENNNNASQATSAINTSSEEEAAEKQDKKEDADLVINKKKNRYEVYFSMIEIYNEVVRDLLTKNHIQQTTTMANSNNMTRRGLKVREHPKRGFFVENLTSIKCANKEEIEQLIEEGQLNKSIVATSMNETSSRGHTIYEFRIRQYRLSETSALDSSSTTVSTTADQSATGQPTKETLTSSEVQLVDLAGSERMVVHASYAPLADLPSSSRSNSPFANPSATLNDSEAISATRSLSSRRNKSTVRSKAGPASASPLGSTTAASGGFKQLLTNNSSNNNNHQQQHHHQRFKESVSINQSLSALGNCIQVLSQYSQQQQQQQQQSSTSSSQPKPPKIPYRDSVLTKLLNRCCLSGNSKVVIIATLSPADANYDDTLSTLRFADRAKQIRTHAMVNRMDTSQVQQQRKAELVGALQRENERLKQLIDGRATTTRSDDSSQTSNFDDTENMLDNFNGPSGRSEAASSSSGKTAKKSAAKTSNVNEGGSGTPTRSRTSVRKRQPVSGGDIGSRSRSRPPATSGKINKSSKPAELKTSASIAALSTGASNNDSPMRRLVSPAASKQGTASRRPRQTTSLSMSDDEAEDDCNEQATVGGSDETLRKSKSLAQVTEMPAASPDVARVDGAITPAMLNQILPEDSYELAELLDEIDLSDLANIDEGLLSPDSDDSFAALAEEGLSNEEKISLLNKLLSNSNMAEKIRKQYEKQQARLQRPKRAGGNRTSSSSKKDNNNNNNVQTMDEDELQKTNTMLAVSNATQKKSNPYLSNLNQDEQLTGMITLIIKEGETIVGKNHDCDFMLYGPELRGRHAKLIRVDKKEGEKNLFEVFVEPIMEPADSQKSKRVALIVNGEPVTKRARLNHCDRLLFGSGAYFVFIDSSYEAANSGEAMDKDSVTYEMAHNEVLKKVMSDANNEAVIKEINDYTHRPGTGKLKSRPTAVQGSEMVSNSTSEIHDAKQSPIKAASTGLLENEVNLEEIHQPKLEKHQINNINEEASNSTTDLSGQQENNQQQMNDDSFKDKLMEDTYEFAMPVAEVNAIAREMAIKVNYGLKILTGEEQFPEYYQQSGISTDQHYNHYRDFLNENSELISGTNSANSSTAEERFTDTSHELIGSKFNTTITRSIKPETLDVPPELFIHVTLEEFNLDFYWSKEKFQERRVKMLELYGAWDLGGKQGLVEYLIEQSKYQGYYMIDPFIDDPLTSFVLIGHAQVILQPLSHMSDMRQSFDILDIHDEIVGSLKIEAIPCHLNENTLDNSKPFEVLNEKELATMFTENPRQLLGKKFVFLLKIVSCSNVPDKFCRVFCQYLMDREQSLIRTNIQRDDSLDGVEMALNSAGSSKSRDSSTTNQQQQQWKQQMRQRQQTKRADEKSGSKQDEVIEFNHSNYVVIDKMNQDILDFLEHGFLTIQLIGQYRLDHIQQQQQQQSSRVNSSTTSAASSSSNPITLSSPTLVSTIINSINKYKYRIEQQGNVSGSGGGNLNNGLYFTENAYVTGLTDSAKSHHRISSSMIKSNSDAPSIASTSATVNLFDQQNEDDDGTMNGLSQENIIDMILTKRKLDRAENQLHYLKRTINIAEHYNKKNIPVKTVKKLLNSYGHELEGGSLEELATEATVEGKSSNSKHSNCIVT